LNGPHLPQDYPAQLINPADGELFYFADSAAASLLKH
jgi:hypothetical protein